MHLKRTVKKILLIGLNLPEGRKLRRFKDTHRGDRCFVLGNGPSLNHQDLTLLRNEYTFVTNRFIQHKDFDTIQPDYYCISDSKFFMAEEGRSQITRIRAAQDQLHNMIVFFSLRFKLNLNIRMGFKENTFYLRYLDWKKVWEMGRLSTDIAHGVYMGHTIIIDFCLPIAYYMGFSEVYLLGCDMSYSDLDSPTHFFGNMEHAKTIAGKDSRTDWYHQVEESYRIAKDTFYASHRKIYDATYRGKLTVFEKVDYPSIILGT
ncbi:MAG: DUF115 domain-containing protein [Fidelibacterota bacterium]|nr:MAG: DUF115 domain-containing protein [Candidatus Neomarinimicrobiota bacterium]